MDDRIACTVNEACRLSGLGRSKLYLLMEEGRVHSIRVGKRRLINLASLRALLEPQQLSFREMLDRSAA